MLIMITQNFQFVNTLFFIDNCILFFIFYIAIMILNKTQGNLLIMENKKQSFKDKITETLNLLRDDEAVENIIKSKVPVRKRKL